MNVIWLVIWWFIDFVETGESVYFLLYYINRDNDLSVWVYDISNMRAVFSHLNLNSFENLQRLLEVVFFLHDKVVFHI